MPFYKNNQDKSIILKCDKCEKILFEQCLSDYFSQCGKEINCEKPCCDIINAIKINWVKLENTSPSEILHLGPSSFKNGGTEMEKDIRYMSHKEENLRYLITDLDLDSDKLEKLVIIVSIFHEISKKMDHDLFENMNRGLSIMLEWCLYILNIVQKTFKICAETFEFLLLMTIMFIFINEMFIMARNSGVVNKNGEPVKVILNTSIVPYLSSIGSEISDNLNKFMEQPPLGISILGALRGDELPVCFTIPSWSEDIYELGYSGLEKCCFVHETECHKEGEFGMCLIRTGIYYGNVPVFRNAGKGQCRFEKANGKGGEGFKNIKL